jgi:hypothetical protein
LPLFYFLLFSNLLLQLLPACVDLAFCDLELLFEPCKLIVNITRGGEPFVLVAEVLDREVRVVSARSKLISEKCELLWALLRLF